MKTLLTQRALEELADYASRPYAKVLDVGCGSGYLTFALALLSNTSQVYGIDIHPSLVSQSIININKSALGRELIDVGRIRCLVGNGWKGYEAGGLYDAIHVGASAETMPADLLHQLKRGGRMVVPVGGQGENQRFLRVDKKADGTLSTTDLFGVRYVPLVQRD